MRNYLIDNVKGLLIFFVVLGHCIGNYSPIHSLIHYNIYCFHMSAFIFISGLLSKNLEKSRNTVFKKLLLPYVVISILWALFNVVVWKDTNLNNFNIFFTNGMCWYLLAIGIMRFICPDILKIKLSILFPFLIVLSIFSYKLLDEETFNFLAMGRVLIFLPLFLLGYMLPIEKISNTKSKRFLYIGLGIMSFIVFNLFLYLNITDVKWWATHNYFSNLQLSSVRFLFIFLSVFIVFFFISILPKTKNLLSSFGENSIIIYLFHLFLLPFIGILYKYICNAYILLLVQCIISFIICYLLSREKIMNVYNKLFNGIWNLISKRK